MQGEGIFAGSRQIFIRFKRCNMECGFCDTPNRPSGKEYSPAQLVREVMTIDKKSGPHHSISLTGGEPLIYAEFLRKLLPSLKEIGFKTYLETNGTLPDKLRQVIDFVDIVAMDFKLPSSTKDRSYWDEHLEFLKIASAKKVFVKAVVTPETKTADIERVVESIKKVNARIPLIIQPATPVKKVDKAVPEDRLREFSDLALKRGVADSRVIPQIHKILGIK
ncbi:MAG: 7-carboxy-7-deazaguanine synthase QueE [Candidatus Omnitrophota bacterium]|nr:7-carboxy-7-deazaguanine synthase QueE [Candidatus Omnitrophota bacterium]